jgi:hypothetical protein
MDPDIVSGVSRSVLVVLSNQVSVYLDVSERYHMLQVSETAFTVLARVVLKILVIDASMLLTMLNAIVAYFLLGTFSKYIQAVDAFLPNIQYVMTGKIQQTLFAMCTEPVIAVLSFILMGVFPTTLGSMVAISCIQSLIIQLTPPTFQFLVTLSTLFAVHPFVSVISDTVYQFIMYRSAQILLDNITQRVSPFQTFLILVVLYLVSPTPTFRSVTRIAYLTAATQCFFVYVQYASDTDPLLCLVGILCVTWYLCSQPLM